MLPQTFHRRFAYFLAEPLTNIYAKSYEDGIVPDFFGSSVVIPIFKKGEKHAASNYRPVPPQGCVAAKVLEKKARHLQAYLSRNNLHDPAQHGFVPRESTCTQLLHISQDWAMLINSKIPFHCVNIDQKVAFDRIPHTKLPDKLAHIEIHPKTRT